MNHNLVPWINIPAVDLERAALFYHSVFGMEFFFEDLNQIPHAVIKEDAQGRKPINGALVQIIDNVEIGRGPMLFFESTGKFELVLEAVVENGGSIAKPKTLIKKVMEKGFAAIPETYVDNMPGYYAHFYDSEGNKMGLYGSN